MNVIHRLLLVLGVTAVAGATLPVPADAADGEKVFNRCQACHSLKPGVTKIGPSLAGVVGRKAGTADNFKRYKGLKGADWTWTEDALMAYLEDPTAYTKAKTGQRSAMGFKLKDVDERKAVIAYLKQH